MPKIAYVCEPCWEDCKDNSCYADRSDVRVLPNGQQICEACHDNGEYDDEPVVPWQDLPMPPEYIPSKA